MLNAACMIGLNKQGLEATSRGNLPSNFTCFATLDQPSRNEVASDLLSQASHTTADCSVQSISAQSVAESSEADASNPFNEAIQEQIGDSSGKDATAPDVDLLPADAAARKDENPHKNEAIHQNLGMPLEEASADRPADQLGSAGTNPFEREIDASNKEVTPAPDDQLPCAADSKEAVGDAECIPIEARDAVLEEVDRADGDDAEEKEKCPCQVLEQCASTESANEPSVTVWRYARPSEKPGAMSSNPKQQGRRRAHSHSGNRIIGAARMCAEERLAADMALAGMTNFKKPPESANKRMVADMALLRQPGINPHGRLTITEISDSRVC